MAATRIVNQIPILLGGDIVELAPQPEFHSASYTTAKLTNALMDIAARPRTTNPPSPKISNIYNRIQSIFPV